MYALYGPERSKVEAEETLRAIDGLRLTVLRPPLVYGPAVKANFLALMRAVALGLPLPLAGPLTRLLPATAAAAPALHWSVWLVVVTILLVTSFRLLAIERSHARRAREERADAPDLAV